MSDLYVGIDLGGTTIRSGLLNSSGKVLSCISVETKGSEGPDAVIGRICESARKVAEDGGASINKVRAVGIGSPGIINLSEGIIIECPNLPGWSNIPLKDKVTEQLNTPIIVENDANAAARGEQWVGAGSDVSSMVILTLGTGIGGGVIIDDRVLHGAFDSAAEIGHMIIAVDGAQCGCGNQGCLEAYASVTALVRRFSEAVTAGGSSSLKEPLTSGEKITGRQIYEAAIEGDELARRTIAETGRYLAAGIVSIMHVLNPAKVVLSGGMINSGNMLMDPLREEVRRRAFASVAEKTQIVFAELGEDAGFIGAAGCALKTFETSA